MIRSLRGELTKLRTVRSTATALLATIALTLLITILTAQGSNTFANDGPHSIDQFHFVHQSLVGDGSITARVVTQQDTGGWAKAGVMIKSGTTSGSPEVALMLTPQHGVRLVAGAHPELTGSSPPGPIWLRLSRTGSEVAGFESLDGATWSIVGRVVIDEIPDESQAGLFVSSPPVADYQQVGPGSISLDYRSTSGKATFDHVDLEGTVTTHAAKDWQSTDVAEPPPTRDDKGENSGGGIPRVDGPAGTVTQDGGVFTLTGSGDIGRVGIAGITLPIDTDPVRDSLMGAQLGLIAVAALGALLMTSEFKTRMIRTTFTACPHRIRVLTAKAIVLGGAVFAAGLVASVGAFYLAQPFQRHNGFTPPAYPHPTLSDPTVLRAVVGTALFLVGIALLSLGLGAMLRGTAGAIAFVLALVIVVPIVASITSVEATTFVNRATPIAGLAILQTRTLTETAIGPWAGFAVLCAYTTAALGCAAWLLRRRDA
jgi:ABC-type transport system involved in multi-copper enzyme maturation permease subunit